MKLLQEVQHEVTPKAFPILQEGNVRERRLKLSFTARLTCMVSQGIHHSPPLVHLRFYILLEKSSGAVEL